MKKKRIYISIPGKTPAKPSAFSISSSIGIFAIDASLCWPRREEDGYIFVPIPSLRPVSLPMASWSLVNTFMLTPNKAVT